jgi:predicted SAM-dependent methyltransferase
MRVLTNLGENKMDEWGNYSDEEKSQIALSIRKRLLGGMSDHDFDAMLRHLSDDEICFDARFGHDTLRSGGLQK